MIDHRVLTADRTVQQTEFANGILVVVNFGAHPFSMADGKVVAGMSHIVVRKEMLGSQPTDGLRAGKQRLPKN